MQARGLIFGAVATIVMAGCNAPAPEISEAKRKQIQFDRIAKIGDQSCLCAMAGRDTSRLDRELKRLTASLETKTWMTSSSPLRADSVCYPQIGERACVGRIVVTHSRLESDFVCTEEQADELQKIWDAAAPDDGTIEGWNKTRKKRDEALLARLKAMHAEAAAQIPQSACN